MSRLCRRKAEILLVVEEVMYELVFMFLLMLSRRSRSAGMRYRTNIQRLVRYRMADKIPRQLQDMNELVGLSDGDCLENLRMNRLTFSRLCSLLRHEGGLIDSRYVSVPEKVALFLSVIAHHTKFSIVRFSFKRSNQTIHHYFHTVLDAVLRLHETLLAKPTPIDDTCTHPRWKHFKGCLGALDGTLIDVTVPECDKPRYRSRKGACSVNVLAACDRRMRFIYMLTGWEGSAADARVLRDAICRTNGFKVPQGNYYLCDGGYTNCEGFLTPYKMVRYHLNEWSTGPSLPQNYKKYFNMNHSKARNVIERTFGLLKKRWSILRSPSFYQIKVQNKLILACALIHNFIRNEMPNDPLGHNLEAFPLSQSDAQENFIDGVTSTQAWSDWRENLAQEMYTNWRAAHA